MREETMRIPSASCPSLPRLAPVNHVTGASGSGCKINDAIVKLAEKITANTVMQDQLQSAVQESAKPCIAFCQWMGVEMSSLNDNL